MKPLALDDCLDVGRPRAVEVNQIVVGDLLFFQFPDHVSIIAGRKAPFGGDPAEGQGSDQAVGDCSSSSFIISAANTGAAAAIRARSVSSPVSNVIDAIR